MSREKIRVGMAQLLVEGGEPERNLERAEELIHKGKEKGCDIVLLPETLDLGWTHPSAMTEAQPIPGPWSDRLCESAKKNQIYVCAGLTEKRGSKTYNSAIFISPQGEILQKHSKINLLGVELPFYSVGTQLGVLETEFGLIGLDICADNYADSLHLGHSLARMGAQIILSPSSWTVDYSMTTIKDPYGEKWFKPFKILASYHQLAVVATTSVGTILGGPYEGKKMVGCSLAVDENGVIAHGTYNEVASELIVADIPLRVRAEKGTAIGQALAKKGYLFDELPKS